ncbi:MAG: SOUL family heme-binding protein [Woeseiaceae bacterium]
MKFANYMLLLLILLPAMSMALEEPEYQVIEQHEDFELRRYDSYLIAEVDVAGGFDNAGNNAFKILAGYIFGDNEVAEKMAMTAPVESRPAASNEKMSMTAPVTSTDADSQGMTTYAFVMERKYTLDSLPRPLDDRIRIRVVPERTMAVRRYSGRWVESKYQQHQEALLSALAARDVQTLGNPVLARYNSPFSLPFMRRNEVMIEVVNNESLSARE